MRKNLIIKRVALALLLLFSLVAILLINKYMAQEEQSQKKSKPTVAPSAPTSDSITKLPDPQKDSSYSIEKALLNRRSIREYKDEALSLEQISQLLWAAQGITDEKSGRTAPSAGALYPLEIYLVAGKVSGIEAGVYKYNSRGHELNKIAIGDIRENLTAKALNQEAVKNAPITIVIAAVPERTRVKYGDRTDRYVAMEAGHSAQNIYLQATALDLGTVSIGAFDDEGVRQVLNIPNDETPLYIMPVGKK